MERSNTIKIATMAVLFAFVSPARAQQSEIKLRDADHAADNITFDRMGPASELFRITFNSSDEATYGFANQPLVLNHSSIVTIGDLKNISNYLIAKRDAYTKIGRLEDAERANLQDSISAVSDTVARLENFDEIKKDYPGTTSLIDVKNVYLYASLYEPLRKAVLTYERYQNDYGSPESTRELKPLDGLSPKASEAIPAAAPSSSHLAQAQRF